MLYGKKENEPEEKSSPYICQTCSHPLADHKNLDLSCASDDDCSCSHYIGRALSPRGDLVFISEKEITTVIEPVEEIPQKPHPQGEVRTTSSTGGQKGVKPERFSLIPVEALEIMARLYNFGAEKYAAHNWRKGYEWSKSYDSLFRHAFASLRGEDIDEETGLPHLAGAAFHCFTLMIFMMEHQEFDDRFVRGREIEHKAKEPFCGWCDGPYRDLPEYNYHWDTCPYRYTKAE